MSLARLLNVLKALGAQRQNEAPAEKRRSAPRLGVETLEDRVVPATTNTTFIMQVYTDLLQRPVDSEGLTAWTSQLDAGKSERDVILAIETSPEFRNAVVERIYQQFLHRSVESGSLPFWSDMLQHASVEQVEANIIASPEFFLNAGGTNTGFLAALYQSALGRPIDPSGQSFFGQQLNSGESRASVAMSILTSQEFRTNLVQFFYQDFLHRSAEPAAVTMWVDQLAHGLSDQGLIASILSAPEYQSQTPPAPTVTTPAQAVTSQATSFTITGTAESGSLVQILRSGTVVGSQQLASGATNFSISVPLTTNGTNSFTATAANALGNVSAPTTVPTITQTDSVVNVTAPANQTNNELATVSLQVVATDSKSKPLTYSATGLPTGLSINPTTGLITGTISVGAATSSPFHVTVKATAGTAQDTANFDWVVTAVPGPALTVPATQQNLNGDTVSGVSATATGTGTDPITYTATNLPPGLTINSTTGAITGTIAATGSNNSPYTVSVTATQAGRPTTKTFTWVVTTGSTTAIPVSLTDPAWVTLPSGVRTFDQTVGTGTAVTVGKSINVDYVGYLTNGTIFDSGNGATFTLDTAHLIAGWVSGVPGMKPGGVRYLDIPASLAYGSAGSGSSIPPNSELVFKITLNSFT